MAKDETMTSFKKSVITWINDHADEIDGFSVYNVGGRGCATIKICLNIGIYSASQIFTYYDVLTMAHCYSLVDIMMGNILNRLKDESSINHVPEYVVDWFNRPRDVDNLLVDPLYKILPKTHIEELLDELEGENKQK